MVNNNNKIINLYKSDDSSFTVDYLTSFIKKFTKVYGSIRAETNLYRLK